MNSLESVCVQALSIRGKSLPNIKWFTDNTLLNFSVGCTYKAQTKEKTTGDEVSNVNV